VNWITHHEKGQFEITLYMFLDKQLQEMCTRGQHTRDVI